MGEIDARRRRRRSHPVGRNDRSEYEIALARNVQFMRRRLSSLETIPIKIIFPVLTIFTLVLALIRFLGIAESPDPDEKWVCLFGLLFFTVASWRYMRLRVIRVDGHNLYISNYTKEIKIPLSEIINVTESGWSRGYWVSIYLKSPSDFGDKIEFIPIPRFLFFEQHPVVRELKSLAAKTSVAVEPTVE